MRPDSPVAVAAFGVSTPFAYWGFHLVRALVEAQAGPAAALHGGGLAEWRDALARRDGAVVLTSDLPDADLAHFVADAGLPLIVFGDEPSVMLDWTMQSRGFDLADAARLCSRVCAALSPGLDARRKLIVGADAAPRQIVRDISRFLWPGRSAEPSGVVVEPPRPRGRPAATQVAAALAAYADLALGRRPEEIVWPLELFTRADGRSWRAPLQLAGPPRALFYGPYMHLPAGEWTARVEFEVAGAPGGVEASTDVRMRDVVVAKALALPARGVFAYDLGFAVRDPHDPVEIRLFLRKAAIEGVFLARSVKVRPQLSSASP